MGVDADRVRARAAYVRQQVAQLEGTVADLTADAFVEAPMAVVAARYQLQTAIEALIDIAYHLAAKLASHAPKDARDAFATMARLGILDGAAMTRYQAMLRFRNRVVHGYLDIDDRQIFEMISGPDLADVRDVLARFERAADSPDSGRTRGAAPPPAVPPG